MEKYLVRFSESDECIADVFKVNLEKDVYLEAMTDDDCSFSEEEKEEIINGEYETPSEWLETYDNCIFDNLDDAIKARWDSINEAFECQYGDED